MAVYNPNLDENVFNRFLCLDQHDSIQAEYVWIVLVVRSKCRTLPKKAGGYKPEDLPERNFDGSSTLQAPGENSEVIIQARAVYKDPFRPGDNSTFSSSFFCICVCD